MWFYRSPSSQRFGTTRRPLFGSRSVCRLLILLFVAGCSCSNNGARVLRVGIDKGWYPVDFGEQTAYVNGYTEELLLEMSKHSGLAFEVIAANMDTLIEGLNQNRYEAILSSLPPYDYNRAKYAFSNNYLEIGPVLIVSFDSQKMDLAHLAEEMVGILAGDPAVYILDKYPTILIREYSSIPNLLDAVAKGEIRAAVLDQIPAAQYVGDLYAGVLKIASQSMNDQGLHMVGCLGAVEMFDQNFKTLKKKNVIRKLLEKWQLSA